ncbi:hypothetical protein CR983_00170 [Candidatus Saccharibacteria bacterium]|nr:MAG: hypothetical protein CR983_00170 [Candidatus Saccharibacteria bacterium]
MDKQTQTQKRNRKTNRVQAIDDVMSIDTVSQDFKTALFITSLSVNLAVFVTWLTYAVIAL